MGTSIEKHRNELENIKKTVELYSDKLETLREYKQDIQTQLLEVIKSEDIIEEFKEKAIESTNNELNKISKRGQELNELLIKEYDKVIKEKEKIQIEIDKINNIKFSGIISNEKKQEVLNMLEKLQKDLSGLDNRAYKISKFLIRL